MVGNYIYPTIQHMLNAEVEKTEFWSQFNLMNNKLFKDFVYPNGIRLEHNVQTIGSEDVPITTYIANATSNYLNKVYTWVVFVKHATKHSNYGMVYVGVIDPTTNKVFCLAKHKINTSHGPAFVINDPIKSVDDSAYYEPGFIKPSKIFSLKDITGDFDNWLAFRNEAPWFNLDLSMRWFDEDKRICLKGPSGMVEPQIDKLRDILSPLINDNYNEKEIVDEIVEVLNDNFAGQFGELMEKGYGISRNSYQTVGPNGQNQSTDSISIRIYGAKTQGENQPYADPRVWIVECNSSNNSVAEFRVGVMSKVNGGIFCLAKG